MDLFHAAWNGAFMGMHLKSWNSCSWQQVNHKLWSKTCSVFPTVNTDQCEHFSCSLFLILIVPWISEKWKSNYHLVWKHKRIRMYVWISVLIFHLSWKINTKGACMKEGQYQEMLKNVPLSRMIFMSSLVSLIDSPRNEFFLLLINSEL